MSEKNPALQSSLVAAAMAAAVKNVFGPSSQKRGGVNIQAISNGYLILSAVRPEKEQVFAESWEKAMELVWMTLHPDKPMPEKKEAPQAMVLPLRKEGH